MINYLFSCVLAASIVAPTAILEISMRFDERPGHASVINAAGSHASQPGQKTPGKSKKYKKKMSKQMKKRKRH